MSTSGAPLSSSPPTMSLCSLSPCPDPPNPQVLHPALPPFGYLLVATTFIGITIPSLQAQLGPWLNAVEELKSERNWLSDLQENPDYSEWKDIQRYVLFASKSNSTHSTIMPLTW